MFYGKVIPLPDDYEISVVYNYLHACDKTKGLPLGKPFL